MPRMNPYRRLDCRNVDLILGGAHFITACVALDERIEPRELNTIGRGKIGGGLDHAFSELGIQVSRVIQSRHPLTGDPLSPGYNRKPTLLQFELSGFLRSFWLCLDFDHTRLMGIHLETADRDMIGDGADRLFREYGEKVTLFLHGRNPETGEFLSDLDASPYPRAKFIGFGHIAPLAEAA